MLAARLAGELLLQHRIVVLQFAALKFKLITANGQLAGLLLVVRLAGSNGGQLGLQLLDLVLVLLLHFLQLVQPYHRITVGRRAVRLRQVIAL